MRTPLIHKTAAIVLVLVYVLTPYVALGHGHSSCKCVHNNIACGTDGFVCACCISDRLTTHCDEVAFKRCHMKRFSNPHAQPPAVNETFIAFDTFTVLIGDITFISNTSTPGFKSPPIKPPASV